MESLGYRSFSILFIHSFIACNMGYAIKSAKEPACSKFPYEEALLEKMIRMEFNVEKMVESIKDTEYEVKNELEKLKSERELAIREREKIGQRIIEERAEFEVKLGQMESDAIEKLTKLANTTESKLSILEKGVNGNIENAESVITRMSEDLRDLKNGTIQDIIDRTNKPKVLFKANNVDDRNPRLNQIMLFKTVLNNHGDGYDKNTGKFTAPVDGEYLFSVQFCNYGSNQINFAFMKDGAKNQPAELENHNHACSSAVYLTELKKNSQLWIESINNHGTVVLYVEDTYRTNIFSGVLIN